MTTSFFRLLHTKDKEASLRTAVDATNAGASAAEVFQVNPGSFAFGSYEVGVIQRTPVPDLSGRVGERLGTLALASLDLKLGLDRANGTSHVFHLPALLEVPGVTLTESGADRKAIESSNGHKVADSDGTESSHEDEVENEGPSTKDNLSDSRPLVAAVASYAIGGPFGRWDLRFAIGQRVQPELPDPSAPLPVCSPEMLQGPDGLPLLQKTDDEQRTSDYPLHIDWDGILVDDPDHSNDIVRRVREVLEVIWPDRDEVIEQEASEILGVRELRDYFRKHGKGGFWDDPISRYSKSRCKAPIYWLLQSSKKNYAIWLSYHRLDKDLLFKTLVNYVEQKIRFETSRLETLRSQKAVAGESGTEAKRLAKDAERQEDFLSELRDFEDKLRRAANLHLEPDLNDGVVLNIAPLHELVPWKEAKKYWNELMDGKYEWSSIGKQLREKGLVK